MLVRATPQSTITSPFRSCASSWSFTAAPTAGSVADAGDTVAVPGRGGSGCVEVAVDPAHQRGPGLRGDEDVAARSAQPAALQRVCDAKSKTGVLRDRAARRQQNAPSRDGPGMPYGAVRRAGRDRPSPGECLPRWQRKRGVNRGWTPSRSDRDCTICVSCRGGTSDSAVATWRRIGSGRGNAGVAPGRHRASDGHVRTVRSAATGDFPINTSVPESPRHRHGNPLVTVAGEGTGDSGSFPGSTPRIRTSPASISLPALAGSRPVPDIQRRPRVVTEHAPSDSDARALVLTSRGRPRHSRPRIRFSTSGRQLFQ